MAVDLIMGYDFLTKMEESAVREAAASGLKSVNKLITLLSQQSREKTNQPSAAGSSIGVGVDCKDVADDAVSKFQKVISLVGRTRTGHARFRRAPVNKSQESQILQPKVYCVKPFQQIIPNECSMMIPKVHGDMEMIIKDSKSAGNSVLSSLTGDYDSKQPSSPSALFQISNFSQVSSAGIGKPSVSSFSLKRKCSSENLGSGKCGGSSDPCHCSKKRKLRTKRVVRVPAISLKMADVPPDDYSWRKYGQKPIKGSPHPRGYYKCSSVRGCPARKHVERALDDPSMLTVTYEGEHSHSPSVSSDTTNLILESS